MADPFGLNNLFANLSLQRLILPLSKAINYLCIFRCSTYGMTSVLIDGQVIFFHYIAISSDNHIVENLLLTLSCHIEKTLLPGESLACNGLNWDIESDAGVDLKTDGLWMF